MEIDEISKLEALRSLHAERVKGYESELSELRSYKANRGYSFNPLLALAIAFIAGLAAGALL
jgi:hypothetical protein